MGDITGFIKYNRSLPGTENPESRIHHFEEFYNETDLEHQKTQSARCMDCGIPFCHSSCPLGNLIPDFNDAVFQEDWLKAYKILDSTNNFPEFTGRICPAPCEGSCVLGINSDPVAIEYVEKSIIERAFNEGYVKPEIPTKRSGKTIAVVGSGPAGLACADQLNQAGHIVTVFEKNDRIGGLLRYGIPDFKLSKNIIDRRLRILEKEGITFHTGITIGKDIDPVDLSDSFDAVVLAGGSEKPRDLPIEGRQYNGINFAMDFLTQCNKRVAGDSIDSASEINVNNKNIVVIGGGDTGSDCIGNSNRLGAKSVTQIELLSKPPSERTEDNPWPLWPMTLKTSSSHEEGCDRKWAIMTKRFVSEDGENLSGIEVVDLEWTKGSNGKYDMSEKKETLRIIPCDQVFLAMGFLHPLKEGLLDKLSIQLDDRGNVKTSDYKAFMENDTCSKNNVFSAGDMRRGQSLVVWAISEGRSCAEAVHNFLTE